MIQIKEIKKSYGSKEVLNGIDLTLEQGQVYGIIGKNGSGKTTLFRCIAGLEIFSGTIISGFDNLKNHLGYLQTNPSMMSLITGSEYLGLLCSARGVKKVDFESQNIFDLPLNQYAESYSTGMKKKLALMGILLQKNDVIILDEPFNGVDIHSNILISAIIEKLKAKGITIIISSHIFSSLSQTCDQIHLLEDGKLTRKFSKNEYADLDNEMKNFVVGQKLNSLIL